MGVDARYNLPQNLENLLPKKEIANMSQEQQISWHSEPISDFNNNRTGYRIWGRKRAISPSGKPYFITTARFVEESALLRSPDPVRLVLDKCAQIDEALFFSVYRVRPEIMDTE